MKKNTGLLIIIVICYAGAVGVWYWYMTNRPLTESDFTTITGTLKSAEEKTTRKSAYLEFYIVESPVRFRVPADGYRDSFNRQAFFANVKPGMKISITAEKAQLDKPNRPPLDPVDTVFVHGLKDDRITYSSLDGRKDWEGKNRLYGFVMAIVLSAAAIGLTVMYVRARLEKSDRGSQEEEDQGRAYPDAGGAYQVRKSKR
jgi:hypothetical protein